MAKEGRNYKHSLQGVQVSNVLSCRSAITHHNTCTCAGEKQNEFRLDASHATAESTEELVKLDSGFLDLMAQVRASWYGRSFYSWNGTELYIAENVREKPSCTLYFDKSTVDVRL